MALTGKSKFCYGLEVTELNSSLDFKSSVGGLEKQATLTIGSYSPTSFIQMLVAAMTAADSGVVYTYTITRSTTKNIVKITSPTGHLELLFLTGTRQASSCRFLLGFAHLDYTGAAEYTAPNTCGTILISTEIGYFYIPSTMMRNVFGSMTVSASGVKEAISFAIQKFIQVNFQHEPESKVITEWMPFFEWSIQQKPFEFVPSVVYPTVYEDVTLESTAADGKGLGYKFDEELPDLPFFYKIGNLKFRVIL